MKPGGGLPTPPLRLVELLDYRSVHSYAFAQSR
jgi:hypothetical protein